MKEIDSNAVHCPGCQGSLRPQILACDACGIKVEGRFSAGVWAQLDESQLRFVQLFVHCEGNIRDMEKALGVSYPTVKALLADINGKLGVPPLAVKSGKEKSPRVRVAFDAAHVLNDLKDGTITYDEALSLIRKNGVKNARRNS
jgi:hypothetical protein